MKNNIRKVFSKNLKQALADKGKTQIELAKYVGVSEPAVTNWVQGIKLPRMDKVDKICEFLNIKRSDLLDESKPKSLQDLDTTGINRIAAKYVGEEFTEEALEEIQNFIDFVKSKNKGKQNDD